MSPSRNKRPIRVRNSPSRISTPHGVITMSSSHSKEWRVSRCRLQPGNSIRSLKRWQLKSRVVGECVIDSWRSPALRSYTRTFVGIQFFAMCVPKRKWITIHRKAGSDAGFRIYPSRIKALALHAAFLQSIASFLFVPLIVQTQCYLQMGSWNLITRKERFISSDGWCPLWSRLTANGSDEVDQNQLTNKYVPLLVEDKMTRCSWHAWGWTSCNDIHYYVIRTKSGVQSKRNPFEQNKWNLLWLAQDSFFPLHYIYLFRHANVSVCYFYIRC